MSIGYRPHCQRHPRPHCQRHSDSRVRLHQQGYRRLCYQRHAFDGMVRTGAATVNTVGIGPTTPDSV